MPNHLITIHEGAPSEVSCRRDGQYHRGLELHGDIDIVPAGMPSIWHSEKATNVLAIGIPSTTLQLVSDQSAAYAELVNRFQIRDPQIEAISWALKTEFEAGSPSGALFVDGLSTALAAYLLRHHSTSLKTSPMENCGMTPGMRRKVIAYIEEHIEQDLSLPTLAAVGGLSISHFKVLFRRATGVPVHQYVIQRRVSRAKELIERGLLPLSEIAQVVGFTHQSHLAHHMRRILGVTPGELRRKLR